MKTLFTLLILLSLFSCERENDYDMNNSSIKTRAFVSGCYVEPVGGGERMKISWTTTTTYVENIQIMDQYNTFRENFYEKMGPWSSEVVAVPHEGSYKIDIKCRDNWYPKDSTTYHEVLYYKYSKFGGSGQVYESWTPKCNHNYSRFDELAYLENANGSVNLTFSCFGEYTMVILKPKDQSYHYSKDIIHNGPVKSETINISGNYSDSFELRFYSKECVYGSSSCTNYMYLFISMSILKPNDDIVYFLRYSPN